MNEKFGNQLQFWQPNYKSDLVYSANVPKGHAIEKSLEIAASDLKRLEVAAVVLRQIIKNAHIESPAMPWPPTSSFLLSSAVQPPAYLQAFVTFLITGK